MNEYFIAQMNRLNLSAYRISKDTGIPYTTINEIYNSKTDINKCSAETVYKLAVYFECEMKDILNFVDPLDNYSGKYRKQKFKWSRTSDEVRLLIYHDGKEVVVDIIPKAYTNRPNEFKKAFTELLIDNYLEEKEWEKML